MTLWPEPSVGLSPAYYESAHKHGGDLALGTSQLCGLGLVSRQPPTPPPPSHLFWACMLTMLLHLRFLICTIG